MNPLKLTKAFNILPKWRNFAKSGHTAHHLLGQWGVDNLAFRGILVFRLLLVATFNWVRKTSSHFNHATFPSSPHSMWPDWAICCTLGNFLKPWATNILPKLPTFFVNFCNGVKIFNFLLKSILGNFYRHLANFYWSHWSHLKHSCLSRGY